MHPLFTTAQIASLRLYVILVFSEQPDVSSSSNERCGTDIRLLMELCVNNGTYYVLINRLARNVPDRTYTTHSQQHS